MEKVTQRLFLIAVLLLVPVYFLPLWLISLNAPQYPEGIGLYIWIDQITGKNPHDLQNINGLNHYIGMKEIHPESIPELKIMPFIIAFLILFGLIAVFLKRSSLLYIWLMLFIVVSVTGLVDFYLWEYDYGHNLNPMAAIKIPGMSYQPPLIGTKQLLNMHTTSLPASGGWLVFFSIMLGISAVLIHFKKKKTNEKTFNQTR
jgi:copper chaperone NosL